MSASSDSVRNACVLNLLKFVFICWCEYYLTLSSKQLLFGFCIRAFRNWRLSKKTVDTFATSMLMTRYTSKKHSCCDLVVILHQWMSRFYVLVKIMLVTSHRDVIAAFKARWPFLAINLENLCNLCTEKCENNAFGNSDTFGGWLCDFLFWRLFC